ncbi:MAG: cytochrome c biogenesis protein ResB [Candidatus Omnitrophota bacterium]
MWLVKKLGSLSFTAFICASLMALLIVATVMESMHGTPFAQKTFYQTKWFDALLSLLWINIFCSTILRIPFKKYHTGFLITHIGILGLLLGSLLTRLLAVEGQMALREGETANTIRLGGYSLSVVVPGKAEHVFDLRKGEHILNGAEKNETMIVKDIIEHAAPQLIVREGTVQNPAQNALQVTLKSPSMGVDQAFWLIEGDQGHLSSAVQFFGPLKVSLGKKEEKISTQSPTLTIAEKSGEILTVLDLNQPAPKEIPLKQKGLTIKGLQYYPYARVSEHKLVNAPQSGSLNPAVEFDAVDGQGRARHYIRFALFPDFESMHHQTSQNEFDIVIDLDVPGAKEEQSYGGPSLNFFIDPDGKFQYQSMSAQEIIKKGAVHSGETIELGWADMLARVEKLYTHALVSHEITAVDVPGEGALAAKVVINHQNGNSPIWVLEGEEKKISVGQNDLFVSIIPAQKQVPFSLTLKDFRKVDYPGTNRPASFESDVTVEDQQENIRLEKTIAMNQPFDYRGFRIFQSSFMQNPNEKEGSVFTIAKNPGISLIYTSSIIIFAGAFLQFYVKPFSRRPENA